MLGQLLGSWQFNFWRGLVSLCAGLLAISPCLLVPSLRRKILKVAPDIEAIGLIALVVAIVAIGCYNHFGSASGA